MCSHGSTLPRARTRRIDKGDAVIMDRPGYVGAIQIFRAARAELHGWDIRNADASELEDLILRYRADM